MEYKMPITGMQRDIFNHQLNFPKTTMYNLCYLFKLSRTIDENLFAKAINSAIDAHPIFRSVFYFDDSGELRQKEIAAPPLNVTAEYVSEAELEKIKATLVQPFSLLDKRLYRCRLFKTELALHLFFDIHHSIMDGLSFYILIKEVNKVYCGQALKAETYSYHHVAEEGFAAREALKDFDAKQYYDQLLQGWDRKTLPKVDGEKTDVLFGEFRHILDLPAKNLKPFLQRHSVDENVFFMTVLALSNAVYNDVEDVVFSWIHHGRNSIKQSRVLGLLMKEHLVRVRFSRDTTVAELLAAVKLAKDKSMGDAFFPFCEYMGLAGKDEIPCFRFQGNLESGFPIGGGDVFHIEKLPNPYKIAPGSFDVAILDKDGRYTVWVEYCAELYRAESVEHWMKLFNSIANALIHANTVEKIRKQNG